MKKILAIFIMILTTISFTSCSQEKNADIITSCYPLYDFTTRIVGDKMQVRNLVKAGVEPHDYEPTAKDIASLSDCKLFIVNGLGLEHYINELTDDIKNKMFTSSASIDLLYDETNTPDPHVWLNPLNAIKIMSNIKTEVTRISPENEAYFESNYQAQKLIFEDLNEEFETSLQNLSSNYLVTSHEAFGYLCNAYNLIQMPIAGLSTEDEPTASAISSLINQIKDLKVTTIFYEELVSDEIARSIASQTGLVCDVLNPIEGLEDGNTTDNYITIMKKNLEAIKKALA